MKKCFYNSFFTLIWILSLLRKHTCLLSGIELDEKINTTLFFNLLHLSVQ